MAVAKSSASELLPNTLESLDVSFEDIVYNVRAGYFTRERKAVLRGASGEFRAGQLSVIVGQSGAGKSSLMDILAGYTTASSGRLLINGLERDERFFRRRACYIMQIDVLQPLLTVHEALTVAAELKLGRYVDHLKKKQRVEELIKALGLSKTRDTRTGALSGGQKKRLAVGLELVSDPPVMFLDEPTSGLDSSTSKQVVWLLRLLARQGRTLVVTMHQPSTPLLSMMDRIYAVAAGRCAYIGAVPLLVPYLDALGLRCPPYHNPMDFLMEVCSGYLGPGEAERLVRSCQNGKCTKWLTPPPMSILPSASLIDENPFVFDDIRLSALPSPRNNERPNKFRLTQRYSTSFWMQSSTLFLRSFKIIWRDPSLTATRLIIHCAIALVVGTLYYNIGNDAKYMRDNYNFMYFSLMFLMFTAFSGVALSFPCDLPIVRREHFNRWYSTGAYYGASWAANIPVQTTCSLLYALIAYWLTGQPPELLRFCLFTFMLTLISLISMGMGLLNGTIFDVKNGVVFGPFFIMPFTIFSGFFLRYLDAPKWIRWLFPFSFLKHGLVGLCISILGDDRKKMDCSGDYCHYILPHKFLQDLNIEAELYSIAVMYLYVILVVVILSAYLILRFRLKRKM